MVTDNLPWSIKTEQWIQEASHVKIPILGICYGHQLIAKALGGKVEDNPNGKEIGTVKIYTSSEIKKDRLFSDAPLTFEAHVTHMQSVLTLPKGATTLAFNDPIREHKTPFRENYAPSGLVFTLNKLDV